MATLSATRASYKSMLTLAAMVLAAILPMALPNSLRAIVEVALILLIASVAALRSLRTP